MKLLIFELANDIIGNLVFNKRNTMYEVILYYNFNPIEEVERFTKLHKNKCKELGLKGRIYISSEGINGTAAGTKEQVEAYKQFVWSLPDSKTPSLSKINQIISRSQN